MRVRVQQGDGISIDKLASICDAVIDAKIALTNLTFGSGGGLLQSATRDTLKFAYNVQGLPRRCGLYVLRQVASRS